MTESRRRRKQIRRKLPPSFKRISSSVAAFFMTQSLPDQNNSPLWILVAWRQLSFVSKPGTIKA
jgi:hypothetical protein